MSISLSGLGVGLKRLFHGQPTVAGGSVYTCPNGKVAQVTSVRICNPTAADLTVRLGLLPSGGAADGSHYLLGDVTIPRNSTFIDDAPIVLAAGDAIEAQSASLPSPTGVTATAGTAGSMAAGTYYLRVTATNTQGESLGSAEISCVTTGSNGSIGLTWTRVLGAAGYKVYLGTSAGAEALQSTITAGTTTTALIQTTATSAGAPPAAGTAGGCVFTIIGAELTA